MENRDKVPFARGRDHESLPIEVHKDQELIDAAQCKTGPIRIQEERFKIDIGSSRIYPVENRFQDKELWLFTKKEISQNAINNV